jgi:hypothetical protein
LVWMGLSQRRLSSGGKSSSASSRGGCYDVTAR